VEATGHPRDSHPRSLLVLVLATLIADEAAVAG